MTEHRRWVNGDGITHEAGFERLAVDAWEWWCSCGVAPTPAPARLDAVQAILVHRSQSMPPTQIHARPARKFKRRTRNDKPA